MKSKLYLLLFSLLFAWSCKTPEARRPVEVKSGSSINESVERNKERFALEEKDINQLMEKDSLNQYITSEQGFWYYYNIQNPTETELADFGDIVEFEYEVKDLNGNSIYTKEELGKQKYRMEKEELISGLREGLKIMKEGETVTFIFPSYKAYGYYGDLEKIGVNMPIISTVTVLNIEQNN
ncbi:MAG: gliding motility-associated peptidyl-prolyl isomerase GldI [Flavobacteriaceae bacterium CG_4_8_14_3_um_filter_34_10]|nr:gliding motility-associated peptidyl-prolyl isomerase GldI [Flavobacteriia bacterium]OIP50442.1 MAG: gliding motility-associated peptidyl-prolyl isomerase GldI [Flavobacteriaceae bacterium CG2_30_34_30]PIQ18247.1 MAG: gliding motility-associated peptidyl-prolyl isomerase GldI [Flavobacteriaceae bacterium CG18_big_fil_WC_8_21_14_2_50_34_36]PIV50191.1 MAG: gliding motility-associated peptidyl-prolyl isomerase GldI [Flavobacteriaceae bacterium CG02_land_8_20_14_3_00_34_13]PIX10692.1 MAG: glidin